MTNSHRQRWITAAVILPFLIVAVLMGGWVLLAAMIAVSALAQYELYSMFWPGRTKLIYKLGGCLLGAGFLYGAFIENPALMLGCLAASFWMGSLGFLTAYGTGNTQARFQNAQVVTAGMLYLPAVIHTVLYLSNVEIALVLLAAFATDIGGFYVGCRFGKHKIWPSVSPKKSWEGSLGGMALCMLVCLCVGLLFGTAPWWAWLILGVFLNCAAQLGDFFESALKRTLGIKDSGTILPGHGGLLDRIDSILLALPAYVLANALYPFF